LCVFCLLYYTERSVQFHLIYCLIYLELQMCSRYFSISLILLVTLACMSSHARIRHVPDDYESIQAGIDASQDGDTVLVQPDIYLENLDSEERKNNDNR